MKYRLTCSNLIITGAVIPSSRCSFLSNFKANSIKCWAICNFNAYLVGSWVRIHFNLGVNLSNLLEIGAIQVKTRYFVQERVVYQQV